MLVSFDKIVPAHEGEKFASYSSMLVENDLPGGLSYMDMQGIVRTESEETY